MHWKVLDSKDAIISAIILPKFKLKWEELQSKYKQTLIDEIQLYAEANDSNETEDINSTQKEKAARRTFTY